MDPSDHDKRDPATGPSDGHRLTHAEGGSSWSDGWLRSTLKNSDEVVKVLDPDGTLRYASPAFGRGRGLAGQGRVRGRVGLALPRHDADRLASLIRRAARSRLTITARSAAVQERPRTRP